MATLMMAMTILTMRITLQNTTRAPARIRNRLPYTSTTRAPNTATAPKNENFPQGAKLGLCCHLRAHAARHCGR
eukprot:1959715-Lingulodinium_polyedra.AAC.1